MDNPSPFLLHCKSVQLDCRPLPEAKPLVMGILNVTPDSFSDGGLYTDVSSAADRAETMLDEGADILDIGAESSRPRGATYGEGATALGSAEEMDRLLPVLEEIIARRPDVCISVDTYKSVVAEAVLSAGASIINDITGLRYDPAIADVAARFGAPLILMHSIGLPGEMPHENPYHDVVETVYSELGVRVDAAEKAGVRQLVLDPGFGFGKSVSDNLKLLSGLNRLLKINRPILVGISRKSTIGSVLSRGEKPVPVSERLFGTLGATAVALQRGASIVRTHDVRATADFVTLMFRTLNADLQPE